MSIQTYYPEMGETKPVAQIEARSCYGSDKWYIWTDLFLTGRGIKTESYSDKTLTETSTRYGKRKYSVTAMAFEKLQREHSVSCEALL